MKVGLRNAASSVNQTSVRADDAGAIQFPVRCPLPYPNLTATTTDMQGNTSQFSDPQVVPWDCNAPRPVPVLASIAPDSQQAPSPTILLTLMGTGFAFDSFAQWNGIELPTTYISSTLVHALVPSYLLLRGNESSVTVFTPFPGGGGSNAALFHLLPPMEIYLPILQR